MFQLEYDLTPVILEAVARIDKAKDISPAKDKLVKVVREDVKKRFDSAPPTTTGGFVHGNVYWDALKESTLRANPDRATGQILIDSGQLRDSVTIDGDANFISDLVGTQFTFGSSLNYADKIIKRPYLFLHDELKEELTLEIIKYIEE